MKISIFASIGCQNLGDELILKNEIKLLEDKYGPKVNFFVFSYDRKNPFFKQKNIKYVEYFPIGIRQKKNLFKNFRNFLKFVSIVMKSDLIVLGGGGIIYDYEVQSTNSPLDLWLKRVKIFNFFNKKYIFFRGGINIKNEENLPKVKEIFEKADSIEVRDYYSYELLKGLGIKSVVSLDPVFYDAGKINLNKSIQGIIPSTKFGRVILGDLDFSGKTIGLAIRSGYFVKNSKISDRMEEGIIRELVNYFLGQNAKVILLPHSFHKEDELANDYTFLKKFLGRTGVEIKNNMQEVYDVYTKGEIDFCFAMRLHSIILCHVYNIPFIGISYSKKTDEVLASLEI